MLDGALPSFGTRFILPASSHSHSSFKWKHNTTCPVHIPRACRPINQLGPPFIKINEKPRITIYLRKIINTKEQQDEQTEQLSLKWIGSSENLTKHLKKEISISLRKFKNFYPESKNRVFWKIREKKEFIEAKIYNVN